MQKISPKIFVAVALAIFVSGCATAPPRPRAGEASLKELCERYSIQLEWDSVSQVVTLSSGDVTARALVGSDVVLIGPEKIALTGMIRRTRDAIFVPQDFEVKVFQRFKKETGFQLKKCQKIVVDAGHGGKDPGARGKTGVKEKHIVLDIAKRLKWDLAKNGFDVVMTRETDDFLTLEKRTEIATKVQGDLFVSIHANSSQSRNVDGFEVYYMGQFLNKDKTEDQRMRNTGTFFSRLKMRQDSPDLDKIVADMMYNQKQCESQIVASRLVRDVSKYVGTQDRGEREARFFVLRNTLIPAVLVEVGYLSNSREEKMLQSDDYRQKIADGIAESIVNYVR